MTDGLSDRSGDDGEPSSEGPAAAAADRVASGPIRPDDSGAEDPVAGGVDAGAGGTVGVAGGVDGRAAEAGGVRSEPAGLGAGAAGDAVAAAAAGVSPEGAGSGPPPAEAGGAPVGRRVVLGMIGLAAAGILVGKRVQSVISDAMAPIQAADPTGITQLLPAAGGFRFYTITDSFPSKSAARLPAARHRPRAESPRFSPSTT